MDRCRTIQHLRVSVVKTMDAPVQAGCFAMHQSPNAKHCPTRLGFQLAVRRTIPAQMHTLVCAAWKYVHPRSMGPIASRPSAVAVVLLENLELTMPIVVNSVVWVGLLILLERWVDARDALPVNMAQQRGKQLKRRVKIAVLEKPRTLLVQSVNRFAKIVSKVPTPTCQVCPVVKFASVDLRRVSRVH